MIAKAEKTDVARLKAIQYADKMGTFVEAKTVKRLFAPLYV